ncbi:MAG: nitroreductase family protein [Actinomycetota bacterium]
MKQPEPSHLAQAEIVLQAIRTTGSMRYQSTRDVPNDVLLAALEAARFGPSGGNRQPVRWIVICEQHVSELLGRPDDVMCACHILVGYPEESFPKKLNRMPLDQLVFSENYGNSYPGSEQGN